MSTQKNYKKTKTTKTKRKEKNIDDFLQIKRWKFYKEFDFMDDFLNDYKKELIRISNTLSLECTQKLQELAKERAYVKYTEQNTSEWYERSNNFSSSFEVGIFIKDNRLKYTIRYFYNDLIADWGEQLYDSVDRTLPRHLSVVTGEDIRDILPDILNVPLTLYESSWDRRYKKKTRRVLRKAGNVVILNTALQLTGSGDYFSSTYKKVATLPAGFRPPTRVMIPVNCGNSIWANAGNGKAQIETDGSISIYCIDSSQNHVQIAAVFPIS